MIDSRELENLIKRLSGASADVTRDLEKSLKDSARDIELGAKSTVPVRTGNLRDSIGFDVKGLEAVIEVDTNKAPYAEEVEKRVPFLDDAFNKAEEVMLNMLENAFYKAIEENI